MNSFRKKAKQIKYITSFVMRSLLITILCFMSLISLVFAIYYGDLLISTKNGITNNPLFGAYIIVSPSMVPTININDAIVIKRMDHDKYKIGDIITFTSADVNYSGKKVTHRIIEKKKYSNEKSLYKTKGDNNNIADSNLVNTSDIYGKVLFKIPGVGKLQSLVASPTNFFLSLLIPAFAVLLYDMTRIFTMMSKRKN